jgi:hypothetical protein
MHYDHGHNYININVSLLLLYVLMQHITEYVRLASKSNPKQFQDWIRKCAIIRQQVGARLEFLASLADKQVPYRIMYT